MISKGSSIFDLHDMYIVQCTGRVIRHWPRGVFASCLCENLSHHDCVHWLLMASEHQSQSSIRGEGLNHLSICDYPHINPRHKCILQLKIFEGNAVNTSQTCLFRTIGTKSFTPFPFQSKITNIKFQIRSYHSGCATYYNNNITNNNCYNCEK